MTISRDAVSGRSHIFYGSLIIIAGFAFLLNNLDLIEAGSIFRFWPILFVLLGVAKIFDSVTPAGRFTGLLFLALGLLLLLDTLDIFEFHFWQWWPLVFILLGGSMLLKSNKRKVPAGDPSIPAGMVEDPDATISVFSFLGGNQRVCTSQDFRGGEITTVMGGSDVDLRRASIKENRAHLSIFVVWGGIKVRVPDGWCVVLDTTPILGGVENKTRPVTTGDGPQLIVTGFAIMGGAEVCH